LKGHDELSDQGANVRRREFLALVSGALGVWPRAVSAQQQRARVRRVGVLMHLSADDSEGQTRLAAFLQGLQEAGWAVGRNVTVDVRWAAASRELMKRFANELVALQPDAIFVTSTPGTGAMLQATRTIPIVFVLVADPVGTGYVASLPRPGGNATGFTPIIASLGGRWTELLKQIAPLTAQVRLLYNPSSAPFIESYLMPFRAAAASLGMKALAAPVEDVPGLEALFANVAREPNSGLVIMPDAFTELHLAETVSLAVRHGVPSVNWSRSFVDGGGLISYGPYLVDEHRRAATYVDRILKGETPSQLPVQAPLKYQLAINLKTAKALGLTVS
jgi:putative ABC transport system substrate-binding protein